MHKQGVELRCKPGELLLPVAHQRRGHDEQARGPRPSGPLPGASPLGRASCRGVARPQPEQEIDHLHRLAQAHVVGQAGPEPEPREKPEPAHARFLIRPKRGPQIEAGLAAGPALGIAERRKRVAKPAPGGHLRPLGHRLEAPVAAAEVGPGEQPHPLHKVDAVGMLPLEPLPVGERLPKTISIHLHPAAPQEREGFGAGEQLGKLRFRERLPLDRHLHRKLKQAVDAHRRWLPVAQAHPHARPRRLAAAPPVGHPHGQPALLHYGHIPQKPVGFGDRDRPRREDRPRVEPLAEKRALLGRGPHRRQELDQPGLVAAAGRLLHGLGQGQMLYCRCSREPVGVGGQKRERPRLVAAVLRQVKGHLAEQVQPGIDGRKRRSQAPLRGTGPLLHGRCQLKPHLAKHPGGEVFKARHRRGGGNCRGERVGIGRRQQPFEVAAALGLEKRRPPLLGEMAHSRDHPPGLAAKEGEVGRQGCGVGETRQMQKPGDLARGEGRRDLRGGLVWHGHGRRLASGRGGLIQKPPVGREPEAMDWRGGWRHGRRDRALVARAFGHR